MAGTCCAPTIACRRSTALLGALLEDLHQRGLLDDTLVVAMGEFGRTPRINPQQGREHWGPCYTVALAGGGIRGGQEFDTGE